MQAHGGFPSCLPSCVSLNTKSSHIFCPPPITLLHNFATYTVIGPKSVVMKPAPQGDPPPRALLPTLASLPMPPLYVRQLVFVFILVLLAGTVEAGWLGSLFGRRDKQQAATVTQGCAAVEVCEAVLLTGSNGINEGKEQEAVDAEGKLLTPSVRTTFKAKRTQSIQVQVQGDKSSKALPDYFLSLDARPHILNAHNFEQISADTFRCEMAPIQFFSASIIPVIDIRLEVDAKAGTAVIHAVSGKIKRSDQLVDPEEARANGYVHTGSGHFDEMSFKMNTVNYVRWQQIDEKTISISSELQMEVSMDKPGWLLVPSSMMNRVGSLILQRVVKKTLPEFLERIQNGYTLWAGGEVVV